jgi:RNA 3'-terminal phosphate cyclase (ATP)
VKGAPTYEYFSDAFLPAIAEFGAKCSAKLMRAGFYPKGGGEILLEAEHSRLSGVSFQPQKGGKVNCSIISSSLPPHVAKREEEEVRRIFSSEEMEVAAADLPALCPGNAVSVWKGFCGGCAIGERGVAAEKVAADAASPLKAALEKDACVDEHMADQLLIYAALAKGRSSFSATGFSSHFKTNCEVVRAMTGRNIILGLDNSAEVI